MYTKLIKNFPKELGYNSKEFINLLNEIELAIAINYFPLVEKRNELINKTPRDLDNQPTIFADGTDVINEFMECATEIKNIESEVNGIVTHLNNILMDNNNPPALTSELFFRSDSNNPPLSEVFSFAYSN